MLDVEGAQLSTSALARGIGNQIKGRPKTAGNKRVDSVAHMSHLKGLLDEPLSLK